MPSVARRRRRRAESRHAPGFSGLEVLLLDDVVAAVASMTDEDILAVHDRCIEAQQASAESFERVAVEVPPRTR